MEAMAVRESVCLTDQTIYRFILNMVWEIYLIQMITLILSIFLFS